MVGVTLGATAAARAFDSASRDKYRDQNSEATTLESVSSCRKDKFPNTLSSQKYDVLFRPEASLR